MIILIFPPTCLLYFKASWQTVSPHKTQLHSVLKYAEHLMLQDFISNVRGQRPSIISHYVRAFVETSQIRQHFLQSYERVTIQRSN